MEQGDAPEGGAEKKVSDSDQEAQHTPVESGEQQPPAPTPVFKKRKTPHARRQKEQDNDEDEDPETLSKIEETRKAQRARERVRGVAPIEEEVVAAALVPVDEAPAGRKLLGDQFTKEENKQDVNVHMQQYIEEQLAKRHGKAVATTENVQAPKKPSIDDLYALPEAFQKPEKQKDAVEEEAGERWLAGIAEVHLPIEYKIKNIERTEVAKQEKFANRTKTMPNVPMPQNISVNFARHNRDVEPRRFKEDQKFDGDGAKVQMATDDRVIHRFIKKQKFK
eukprot:TRINITY_DN16882_c0_g2_i1.p1 TRINITY_DN16882_c0_g2~~TRINITY_DN16882_c0_g2_i1.p1  ORF type:complete len:289 (+),score=65.14 TRINITY_DN16882_c0_g2_i1:32-868(+)